MSRAGNMVGSFVIEDRGGDYKRPCTAVDEDKLRGRWLYKGRLTRPHVDTLAGPFVIGIVSLPPPGRACRFCHASKVRQRNGDGQDFCFGCGALQ